MKRERFLRERELFERACELPADDRGAFLARECDGDAELAAGVEKLLALDPADEVILGAAAEAAAQLLSPGTPPERIPGFRILEELGSGGMGVVYLAEQESTARRVALKVLRPGASAAVAARFQREARLLARLRHPNIPEVYIAGEDSGRPWIAMELVDGPPLLEHARGLDRRSRIELLRSVADALGHVHDQGIVHRDLRPQNVCITADGQPKLIDFGIARVQEPTTLESLLQTREGDFLGNLVYLAPEQLAGDPDAIDARTDTYTLGLLLYELISGRPAFVPRGRTPAEVRAELLGRVIPPLGQVDPRSCGDLEAITMRALAEDPAERYPDGAAFARELGRFLAGEPVEARAEGFFRGMLRRARSQRAVLGGLGLAGIGLALAVTGGQWPAHLALSGGSVLLFLGALRAEQGRRLAERERARASRMLAFLRDMLAAPDPSREGSKALLLDVVERATRDLDERFASEPAIEGILRRTLGITYRGLGRYEEARVQITRAIELMRQARARDPLEEATTLGWLAILDREQGRYTEAERRWREVIALRSTTLGPHDPSLHEARVQQAMTLQALGESDAAIALARAALQGLRAVLPPASRQLLVACGNFASMLLRVGEHGEGERLLRESADGLRRLGASELPEALVAEHNLASALAAQGRYGEALTLTRCSFESHALLFGPEHRATHMVAITLAGLLTDTGQVGEARRVLLPACRSLRRHLQHSSPQLLAASAILVELRAARGLDCAALRSARRIGRSVDPRALQAPSLRRRLDRVLQAPQRVPSAGLARGEGPSD